MTEQEIRREARRLTEIAMQNNKWAGGHAISLVEAALRELMRRGDITTQPAAS